MSFRDVDNRFIFLFQSAIVSASGKDMSPNLDSYINIAHTHTICKYSDKIIWRPSKTDKCKISLEAYVNKNTNMVR